MKYGYRFDNSHIYEVLPDPNHAKLNEFVELVAEEFNISMVDLTGAFPETIKSTETDTQIAERLTVGSLDIKQLSENLRRNPDIKVQHDGDVLKIESIVE